jgi:DNA-binding response OmpR family regulator
VQPHTPTTQRGAQVPATANSKRCVVLVDHDLDTRVIYATLLKHIGWRVVHTRDPDVGLHLAKRLRPDAVVCELGLELLSGESLIEGLRSERATAAVPIVVVTSRLLPREDVARLAHGCNRLLAKPCTAREVLVAVEQTCSRSA